MSDCKPVFSRRFRKTAETVLWAALGIALAVWLALAILFPRDMSCQWSGLLLDPEADCQKVDTVRLSFEGQQLTLFQKQDSYFLEGELTACMGDREESIPLYASKTGLSLDGWRELMCFSKVVGGTEWARLWDMEAPVICYAHGGRQVAALLTRPEGGTLLLIAGKISTTEEELVAAGRDFFSRIS